MILNRKLIAWLVAAVFIPAAVLAGCGGEASQRVVVPDWPGTAGGEGPGPDISTSQGGKGSADPGSWAIYWYLCGSDLESQGGLGTMDLMEMSKVALPENVTVVIETGGAAEWKNDAVSADVLGRYLYTGDQLELIETRPAANMGDPGTLADFLAFCNQNYPAGKQAVILWDHGGGSLYGVVFDELNEADSLSLPELEQALDAAPASSGIYEFIGFDACLMATVDVADILRGNARYMIASEEMEPGGGWDYTGFMKALSDGAHDTPQLGKAICDSFYAACAAGGEEGEATLSVVDLEKAGALVEAYQGMGDEALLAGCVYLQPYLGAFSRAALAAERYGPNSEDEGGYVNMVDLGDLVRLAGDELLPRTGAQVLSALEDCVVYQVKGPLRKQAGGISCYYNFADASLDMGTEGLMTFSEIGTSRAFEWFYAYSLMGYFSTEAEDYVTKLAEASGYGDFTVVHDIWASYQGSLQDLPVSEKGGGWELTLDPESLACVSDAQFGLGYHDASAGGIVLLGRNRAVSVDWEKGVIRADAPAAWGALDGVFVSMEPASATEEYEIYRVPILLNEERYTLSVSFANGAYEILGARKAVDKSTGLVDKNLRKLVPGDIVKPVCQMANGADEITPGDIIVTDSTAFAAKPLPPGSYQATLVMIDFANNAHPSQPAAFNR